MSSAPTSNYEMTAFHAPSESLSDSPTYAQSLAGREVFDVDSISSIVTTKEISDDRQDRASIWNELEYLKFCLQTEVNNRILANEHLASEIAEVQRSQSEIFSHLKESIAASHEWCITLSKQLEEKISSMLSHTNRLEKSIQNLGDATKMHDAELQGHETNIEEAIRRAESESQSRLSLHENVQCGSNANSLTDKLRRPISPTRAVSQFFEPISRTPSRNQVWSCKQDDGNCLAFEASYKGEQVAPSETFAASSRSGSQKRSEPISLVSRPVTPRRYHANVSPPRIAPQSVPNMTSSAPRFHLVGAPITSGNRLERSTNHPTARRSLGMISLSVQAEKPSTRKECNVLSRHRSYSPDSSTSGFLNRSMPLMWSMDAALENATQDRAMNKSRF